MLFVWVALLGRLAFRRAGHFSIEACVSCLPAPLRRGVAVSMRCVLLGFLLLVVYLGLQATLRVREQLTTAMEVSMSWGYASVPVSFTRMACELVCLLGRTSAAGRDDRSPVRRSGGSDRSTFRHLPSQGLASTSAAAIQAKGPLLFVPQKIYTALHSFPLLALHPGWILPGNG